MSYFKEANQLLRDARAANVIDTMLPQFQDLIFGPCNQYKAMMKNLSLQSKDLLENSPWLGKQSSHQMPQTRRYQQSKAPSLAPLVQPVGGDWMAELARFPVPVGSVGIIKGFEQYLAQDQTVFSASPNWGNPFPSVSVRWFFRLSHWQKIGDPWINVTGPSAIIDYLPGTSYDDFSDTSSLWFPAGSSSSSNIHLPIPGGYVLRLVALVSSSERVSIAAKLIGSTQIELNNDAQFVVRTTW